MPQVQFGVQYNGVSMSEVIGPLEFARRMETLGYRPIPQRGGIRQSSARKGGCGQMPLTMERLKYAGRGQLHLPARRCLRVACPQYGSASSRLQLEEWT